MSAVEETTQEAYLSSLKSRSTLVPTTTPTSTKRRAKAPAGPTALKKTKTAGKFDEVADLLQQYRPPPVAAVQHERDVVKHELEKTKDEAAKQKTEALQEIYKTKMETAKQQTKTLQQLLSTVHLMNQVRSQLDVTVSERDREVRDNMALKNQLSVSIDEARTFKSQAETRENQLSKSRAYGSKLQNDLTSTNTALKDTTKELASSKKDAALTKQVLVKQRDEVKKELATVKTDALVTEKLLKNKNEEVTKELALVKTDAAVTEKLLENKVEQLEGAQDRERALHGMLMQQLEHEHQGNEQALEAIRTSLYSTFGVHVKED